MELKINELLELIREQVELFEEKSPEGSSPPLEDWLPTIKITERWGEQRSASREQLKLFVNQVDKAVRDENTFEGRVKSLANFINDETCPKTIAQTFARLMMLDLLVTVADEFTESAGGFILEALSAALSGYKGKQVVEKRPDGTLPIVDFTDGEIDYSLKLLSGDPEGRGRSSKSGVTKGSINNLLVHLADGGECGEKPQVRYIVAYRDAQNLTFVGFDITCENVGEVMVLKGDDFNKKAFGLNSMQVADKNAKELLAAFDERKIDKKLEKTQFALTRGNIEKIGNKVEIASIPVGRDALAEAASRCAEKLQEELIPIYKAMKDLTDNTHIYFLDRKGDKRTQAADAIMSIVSSGGELPRSIKAAGIGEIEEEL